MYTDFNTSTDNMALNKMEDGVERAYNKSCLDEELFKPYDVANIVAAMPAHVLWRLYQELFPTYMWQVSSFPFWM